MTLFRSTYLTTLSGFPRQPQQIWGNVSPRLSFFYSTFHILVVSFMADPGDLRWI
jgi:hypothetical protein